MALVVQISTYEELKKIIAESGKEYDREQIEAAYRLAQEQGYQIVSNGGEFLPFWQNGVKFFILLGPNQERVEFNQYL